MRFEKKSRIDQTVPTASMADIAFLLLIFFMVSTVFITYRGLPVILPKAQKIEELKTRRNIANLWIGTDGTLVIDDDKVDISSIRSVMYNKLSENPRIIVSLKCDEEAPCGVLYDVLVELRESQALRVNFATDRKKEPR